MYNSCLKITGSVAVSTPAFGCIMDAKKGFAKGDIFSVQTYFDDVINTVKPKEWIAFLEKCGLPISIQQETEHKIDVTWEKEKYLNIGHFMASFTAYRYLFDFYKTNGRLNSYKEVSNIPEIAISLKEKYNNLSEIECLQLAHYMAVPSYPDDLHMCFGTPSKLVSLEMFLEKVKKTDSCNSGFFMDYVDMDWCKLHTELNKNFDDTLKLLM